MFLRGSFAGSSMRGTETTTAGGSFFLRPMLIAINRATMAALAAVEVKNTRAHKANLVFRPAARSAFSRRLSFGTAAAFPFERPRPRRDFVFLESRRPAFLPRLDSVLGLASGVATDSGFSETSGVSTAFSSVALDEGLRRGRARLRGLRFCRSASPFAMRKSRAGRAGFQAMQKVAPLRADLRVTFCAALDRWRSGRNPERR